MNLYKTIFTFLLLNLFLTAGAQQTGNIEAGHPQSFSVSVADLNSILEKNAEDRVKMPANKYLDGAKVLLNSRNGDMQFMRLKLAYFERGFLHIQVNGVYSTQVFVMSDDDSVFYKGEIKGDILTMEKCEKDDIVVE